MLDIKRIREDFDGVKKAVESRGKGDFGIDDVRTYDLKRREILSTVEQMKNEQKVKSKQIPIMKKEGKDTTELMAEMKALSEKIKELYDVDIDKKRIVTDDIRSFGTYECTLKIYTGITAMVYIMVGE